MNADKVNLSIGGVRLVENGMNCNIPLTSLTDIMSEHDITMTLIWRQGMSVLQSGPVISAMNMSKLMVNTIPEIC